MRSRVLTYLRKPARLLLWSMTAISCVRGSWAWFYAGMIGMCLVLVTELHAELQTKLRAQLQLTPRWVLPLALAIQGFLLLVPVTAITWMVASFTGWRAQP